MECPRKKMGKNMSQYTHRKGKHAPTPFWVPRLFPFGTPNVLRYEVQFSPTAEYRHGDNYDGWNKLFGLDTTLWTPGNKGWSYMWAWRWLDGRIELAAYVNLPDGTHVANHVASIKPGHRIELAIFFGDPIRFIARPQFGEELRYAHPHGAPRTILSRTIGPWFGGVYPAPHDISIQLKRL
jgi:hypothetical protein